GGLGFVHAAKESKAAKRMFDFFINSLLMLRCSFSKINNFSLKKNVAFFYAGKVCINVLNGRRIKGIENYKLACKL
ncbi:MAG: hypothetical protein ABIY35_03690, partial [Chitinophagaceae bacterium]